jgi:hypothetical protein
MAAAKNVHHPAFKDRVCKPFRGLRDLRLLFPDRFNNSSALVQVGFN